MKRNGAARLLLAILFGIGTTTPTHAQSGDAKNALAPIAFLIGTWQNGKGVVADTGETSTGTSTFTSEVGGAAMLRRDHTDLIGKNGEPAGSFEQLMMIYADGPQLEADYTDGTHVIHYTSATVTPERAVTFNSAAGAGPRYRLTYELTDSQTLAVRFEISAPGSTEYRPIATGTLKRKPQ